MMKKILFFLQSEGRGHLTQAISFRNALKDSDYEVIGCVLGTTIDKKIPEYFRNSLNVPIWEVESPQFVKKDNKSISISKTIFKNIGKVDTYINSLKQIEDIVNNEKPDLIINFYETLTGLWNYKFNKNKISVISIGHQFIFEHSNFKFHNDNKFQQFLLKTMNKITSYGSKERWGLSFYEICDDRDLKIIPPLIREDVLDKKTSLEDFVLVYLSNIGYLEEIIFLAKCYVHNFKVFTNVDDIQTPSKNITIYPLSDVQFLDEMSRCKGVMMTSGFESVCEAKYLNKPALLIPIENHYEQECNAFDAEKIAAGKYSHNFNFINFLLYKDKYDSDNLEYVKWVNSYKSKLIYRLNQIFSNEVD